MDNMDENILKFCIEHVIDNGFIQKYNNITMCIIVCILSKYGDDKRLSKILNHLDDTIINMEDFYDKYPALYAIEYDNTKCAELILSNFKISKDQILYYCKGIPKIRNINIVNVICKYSVILYGQSVLNSKYPEYSNSSLFDIACTEGNYDVINILLKYGVGMSFNSFM